jgi:dihydropteroate synthase
MKKSTLNCNGKLVTIDKPKVMGIVNITPDSFFDGNNYCTEVKLLKRCEAILSEGADIIDVGAVSTRPGSFSPDSMEEKKRLSFALSLIRKHFPDALISIDTFRAEVARDMAANYGIDFINDISSGDLDPEMFGTVAELKIPYVMMHMKGTPDNMQEQPVYEDPVAEIVRYFSVRTAELHHLGVADIIIDPGFGFGKTIEHNYEILRSLKEFEIFRLPVLVGVSRKSMIYRLLETNPQEALNGTTAVHTLALMNGADILRVHDVKEAVECIRIVQAYNR